MGEFSLEETWGGEFFFLVTLASNKPLLNGKSLCNTCTKTLTSNRNGNQQTANVPSTTAAICTSFQNRYRSGSRVSLKPKRPKTFLSRPATRQGTKKINEIKWTDYNDKIINNLFLPLHQCVLSTVFNTFQSSVKKKTSLLQLHKLFEPASLPWAERRIDTSRHQPLGGMYWETTLIGSGNW